MTAVRTGSTEEAATVEYTLNELGENSAAADVDFERPTLNGRENTGQIVFEAGDAEASFTIPILDDESIEDNESFAVGLQNPSTGTLGAPRTKLVTIVDDDSPSEISFTQTNVNVAESETTATVTVQRSGNTDEAVSATYSISDGTAAYQEDYDGATSGTINFTVGQTAQTISIPIEEDNIVEGTETFTITLDGATDATLGERVTTTVSILDNDLELGSLTRTEPITGLNQPTTLDWTPDERYMLVAQKGGIVRVVDNGVLRSTPLIDISEQVNGTRDRGLLGLAIHPEFPSTPYVYLLHTYDPPETAGRTDLGGPDQSGNRPSRLVRVTVNPATMVADPGSLVVLAGTNSTWEYTSRPTGNSTGDDSIPPSGIVNGTTITAPASDIEIGTQDNDPSRPGIQNQNIRDYLATDSESHSIGDLEFGDDGYLYLTVGDGTSYNFVDPRTVRVQDINNLSGKLLRIDPITGEGVDTNPFYNGDGDSNQSKVFYYGMRNPFRFAFDPTTDLPVIGEVGWGSWEEINTGPAGSNFGWPYFEGPGPTGLYQDLEQAEAFYDNGNRNNPGDAAAVLPILSRRHGAPDNANAILVGDFYNANTLMFGDINNGTLYAATLDENRQVSDVQVFDSGNPFVVDMKMGPDGKLYGVNLVNGTIQRWEPDDAPTPPTPPTNTYNGNSYVLTDGVKTWEEAQADAESLGGNLVSINDAAEETWLKQTFGEGERLWIGINDVAVEGQFEWASGEAVTYTNWAPGEPNDFAGVQDYGLMNFSTTSQWDDERPTRTFRGIIEIAGDTPEPPASSGLTVSFDDFSDISAFSLNGSAASAVDRLRLTPDTRTQAGSAFLNEALVVNSTTRFSSQFQFQLNGGQGTGGADGFTFILQNSGAGAGALGGSGGNVGYSGIDASIAIEFDTYQGSGDPNDNHISLLQNGETIGGLLNADTGLDLNSRDTLTAWVDYDGATNELSVYLSDTGVKPLDALLSYNLDLEAILGGQAYVGFSAGTGGGTNNHDILNWSFESDD